VGRAVRTVNGSARSSLEEEIPGLRFDTFGLGLLDRNEPPLVRRRGHERACARQSAKTSVDLLAASSMPWQRTDFGGIEMKILYQDDEGHSTVLFKMAPGAVVPLHEHTALEQTFMREGSLEDAEGSVGAGDFVWRPGGNIHVAHAPHGATFISVFNRPNRFFDGTKFFTSG
jgi:quercetin dioxygenase-like cupin family protein